jgi:type VI secretion system secreted protein Hcp
VIRVPQFAAAALPPGGTLRPGAVQIAPNQFRLDAELETGIIGRVSRLGVGIFGMPPVPANSAATREARRDRMAQTDCFLKLGDIKGEATDEKHKEEMEVESFSWGQTQAGSSGLGGGAGSGRAKPEDLQLVKKVDKATPVLFVGCATGRHFGSAVLTARKAGAYPIDYLVVTLKDVMISSYRLIDSPQADLIPTEQLSLNFSSIYITYRPQRPDGSAGPNVQQGYDFRANKAV